MSTGKRLRSWCSHLRLLHGLKEGQRARRVLLFATIVMVDDLIRDYKIKLRMRRGIDPVSWTVMDRKERFLCVVNGHAVGAVIV